MCEVCIQIWVHSVFRRNNCGVCCIHVGGNFISEVIYKSTYVRIHAHIGATRWAATGSDGSVEEGGEWVEYRDSEAGSGWEREAGPGPRQEGKVDSGFFTSCSGRCSDLRVVRVNTSVPLRAIALRCSQHIFPKHTLHRSVYAYALYLYVQTCTPTTLPYLRNEISIVAFVLVEFEHADMLPRYVHGSHRVVIVHSLFEYCRRRRRRKLVCSSCRRTAI